MNTVSISLLLASSLKLMDIDDDQFGRTSTLNIGMLPKKSAT